ncbi:MAG: AAA family ATPase, partial [Acidimicrobiales bacterium]|nr:AAA family ATPase [Acidimicrobiales bacterium]
MFLKTLSLKGFKSFADHASLELEPGVTVVVGPNGSGKSNVVDAIAWVLGAQKPSAVRSQKMDDVIFAGTAKRQALGRAEVALTIDNSSRLLPIEFEEVTITRTLFRTGESEYSINGVPCRLLDVQELLSDSGVGRQQHVIVSQGQIDAVLNARPEERRSVIEEAAGVLKYRRRKEKAERRLAATEENLNRVHDLLREVRRGLRPLERQADAARRHGDLIDELRALQIHLAGREIAELRSRLQQVGGAKREIHLAERELKATLARLDEAVTLAEQRLTSAGVDDLGDALTRVESLRERARGLVALLSERLRGIEREQGASVGRDVVASLDHEASTLRVELVEVEDETHALAPRVDELSSAEEHLAEQRSLFDIDTETEDDQPTGQAAEVRGELQALARGIEGAEREQRELTERLGSLQSTIEQRERDLDERRGALDDTERQLAELADELTSAGHATEATDAEVQRRDLDVRAAEGERHHWTARADALALALDEARERAGAERLADVDGVLGTLLELVEIDEGWEGAFEAALGDAMAAVVVRDVDAARDALRTLREGDMAGAVLALGVVRSAVGAGQASGVRAHVRSNVPAVEALLDSLVGAAVVVDDWAEAVETVLRHPGALVVTKDGDRF